MVLPVDERQMIQQLIAGDPVVWSEFVAQFQRRIAGCIRQTAIQCQFDLNNAEVDDICAEVFAGLIANDFRALRNFRGQCQLSTWLSVIARRSCLGHLTRIRRIQDKTLRHAETSHHYDMPQTDVLSRMIRDEQHDQIQSSVQCLNDKDQMLLDLYFYQQLSYAEIGKRAGISINSVGPKLGRAIGRLRKALKTA